MISIILLLLFCFSFAAFALENRLLLELTCDGDLSVLPGNELGVHLSLGDKWYKYTKNYFDIVYKNDALCACPHMTRDQFDRLFSVGTAAYLLSLNEGGNALDWSALCPTGKQQFDDDFSRFGQSAGFAFPSTFTADGLLSGTPQYVEYKVNTTADVRFGVGLGLCPAKADQIQTTWLQFYTAGLDAPNFFRPCNNAADCGSPGLQCKPADWDVQEPFVEASDIWQLLTNAGLYSNKDAPGCLPPQNIWANLQTFVARKFFDSKAVPIAAPSTAAALTQVCWPHSIDTFKDLLNSADTCQTNSNDTVSCPAVVAGGSSVPPVPSTNAAAANKANKAAVNPLTPGARVLLDYDGAKSISIAPSYPQFAVDATFDPRPVMQWLRDSVVDIATCRAKAAGIPPLSEDQIDTYFGFSKTWFAALTTPVVGLAPSPHLASVYDQLLNAGGTIKMPATCSYKSWPECAFSWDGLTSLTGLDITINFRMIQNAAKTSASVYVECVGSGCDLLDVLPCSGTGQSTCPVNAECVDVAAQFNSPSVMWLYRYSSRTPCTSRTAQDVDIRAIANILGNGQDTSNRCFPPIIDYNSIEDWARAQVQANGNTIRMTSVSGWTIDPQPNPTTNTHPPHHQHTHGQSHASSSNPAHHQQSGTGGQTGTKHHDRSKPHSPSDNGQFSMLDVVLIVIVAALLFCGLGAFVAHSVGKKNSSPSFETV